MANNTLAYGFASLSQMLGERVTTQNTGLVRDAIAASAAEYSRMIGEAVSALADRTTLAKERYQLPGSGTLQPIDEFGIPLPVRPAGYYDVAYPIFGGGTAFGRNRVTSALETVADMNRDQVLAEQQDADWMVRHMLAALFDNVAWTYSDPLLGNLTVQPLAITSDGVQYVATGGVAATAQHYLAQTAAIADATNPYTTGYNLLSKYPSNVGRDIVAFIPTNLVATTEALTEFVEVLDPDIRVGANTAVLQASGEGLKAMGDMVRGKVSKVWVVEWKRLPDNNILFVVDGRPPLAMRQYDAAQLQGFFPEFHSPDGARIERRYLRYAGFGVRDRVAAAIIQVSGSDTTYDIPTGYDAPLPV